MRLMFIVVKTTNGIPLHVLVDLDGNTTYFRGPRSSGVHNYDSHTIREYDDLVECWNSNALLHMPYKLTSTGTIIMVLWKSGKYYEDFLSGMQHVATKVPLKDLP